MVEEEPSPPVVVPEVAVAAPPVPIGFHNRIAVRVALLTGIMAVLLSALSGPWSLLWLVAGGFFAVYLYRRRTGIKLSVLGGAHLGWLSGIFGFVLVMVVVTMGAVALSQTDMLPAVREQMKSYSVSEKDVDQMLELFRSPSGLVGVLLSTFVAFTVLPAFGGAVGAKLLSRD